MIFEKEMFTILIRLSIAAVLSAIIGYERQLKQESAGLRTHMLVCVGSTLFTVVGMYGFGGDPARIAAGIVTGIGFLGAGTIMASGGHVKGLTTAASVWATAAIGLAVGVGYYFAALITTILVIVILELWRLEYKAGLKGRTLKEVE